MKKPALTLLFGSLLLACGCSSLDYGDPDKVETLTIDFGSTDLQILAGTMVQSLNESPALAYVDHPGKGDDKRPILYIGGVQNRTSEHIDTEGITDSIMVSLQQGGRIRIAASAQGQDEIGEQVRFQQGSGRVDPAQAKAFGKQIGADLILYGTLRSIEKHKGRNLEDGLYKKDDVWYQFVLSCENIESGEVIWANEETIRKSKKTGVFGR